MLDTLPDQNDFLRRLTLCWSAQTSSDPQNWCESTPAWGQCAVTSALILDVFGGEIVRTFYETPEGVQSSHYFNILPDGTRWDATHQQFPKGTIFSPPLEASLDDFRAATRSHLAKKGFEGTVYAYILSFSGTCARFEKLKKCMEKSV